MLAGDARFDSPGFSAKYATYLIQVTIHDKYLTLTVFYLQEMGTKKIIAVEVGMKGQVCITYIKYSHQHVYYNSYIRYAVVTRWRWRAANDYSNIFKI